MLAPEMVAELVIANMEFLPPRPLPQPAPALQTPAAPLQPAGPSAAALAAAALPAPLSAEECGELASAVLAKMLSSQCEVISP